MTVPADEGFSEAVTEGHIYARSLFVCEADGTILERVPLDPSTAVTVGSGLVRRTGTIVIANEADRYTPAAGGLIDIGRSFLLRFTIRMPTGNLSCDQPLLFPDSDELDVGGHSVTIPVSDGMRIVSDDATLSEPINFPDGTALEDIVRSLLVGCGAPDDDAFFDVQSGGEHVTGVHGYGIGTRVADTLNQLLRDHDCDLWAAPPCVYTLRPVPDPLEADPVATWQLGRQVRMLGMKITRVSRAKNHAIVQGLDPFGKAFTVHVYDLNPDSPVMWNKVGVGDLPVTWQSDGITNVDQARAVGNGLLTRGFSRSFDALLPVDPSRDRRDVVRIVEPSTGIDTVAMLDGFSLPGAPGSQQITVHDARSLA